ncbi:MAG: hypothetical protein HYY01_00950 [Chloroflexi bacterium]|nr:hypothetical protein [Chloroflexota bacterium]
MARPTIGARRSSVEIISEMLHLCRGNGITKTGIMYGSNLSYDQLVRYLALLCRHAFIEKDISGRFVLTEMGEGALRQIQGVMTLLSELQTVDGGNGGNGDGARQMAGAVAN